MSDTYEVLLERAASAVAGDHRLVDDWDRATARRVLIELRLVEADALDAKGRTR
jgi:hypothetical protein